MPKVATCPKCAASIDDTHEYSWCMKCGEPLPDDIKKTLPSLSTRLSGQPVFEAATVAADPRVAGFAIRAAARVIDMVVGLVVGIMSMLIATIVLAIRDAAGSPEAWLHVMSRFSFLGIVASLLGNSAYHSISEAVGGASVGKLMCGLRVVSEDFGPVSFRGTVIRSVGFWADGFLFGAIGYAAMNRSALRQRLGDRWGHTAVVKARVFGTAVRGPARVLLGLLLGLAAWVGILVFRSVATVGTG